MIDSDSDDLTGEIGPYIKFKDLPVRKRHSLKSLSANFVENGIIFLSFSKTHQNWLTILFMERKSTYRKSMRTVRE